MTNEQIVERIQSLMRKRGVKQKSVLAACGIENASFLSEVKRGKRAVSTEWVGDLASALGTTTAYLMGEVDDPAPAPKETPAQARDEQEVLKAVRAAFGDQAAEIIQLCQNAPESWKDAALDVLRRASAAKE